MSHSICSLCIFVFSILGSWAKDFYYYEDYTPPPKKKSVHWV